MGGILPASELEAFTSRAGRVASPPPAAPPRSCEPVHPTTANAITTNTTMTWIALLAFPLSGVCVARSAGARCARARRPAVPRTLTDIGATPMVRNAFPCELRAVRPCSGPTSQHSPAAHRTPVRRDRLWGSLILGIFATISPRPLSSTLTAAPDKAQSEPQSPLQCCLGLHIPHI